jgi:hypothetical protein
MSQNLDLTQFFTRDQIRKLLQQNLHKVHTEPLTDGHGNLIFATDLAGNGDVIVVVGVPD